jgi:thioredoxin-like negative regulator of GroEL
MTVLQTQDQLEELLRRGEYKDAQVHPFVVIYFTADWCGACRRLNLAQILNEFPSARWFVCDVDDNQYSAGYCGVKSIPSFMVINNGKPSQLFTNSDTLSVINWIQANRS